MRRYTAHCMFTMGHITDARAPEAEESLDRRSCGDAHAECTPNPLGSRFFKGGCSGNRV